MPPAGDRGDQTAAVGHQMALQAQGADEGSTTRRCWNRTRSSSRERGNPWACCWFRVLHPNSSDTTFSVLWVDQAAWTVGETAFYSLWCLKGLVIPHAAALQSLCGFTFSWELCFGKRLMLPQSLEVHRAQCLPRGSCTLSTSS